MDPADWEVGRADALAGRPYRQKAVPDMLAYASGYVEGKAERRLQGSGTR